MMPLDSSTLIFVVFACATIALIATLIAALYDRLTRSALYQRRVRRAMRQAAAAVTHPLQRVHRKEDAAQDLDAATLALLALLPMIVVVVDADGEVVQANPQAYRLSIVKDDALSNEQVAQALQRVREQGGHETLGLQTSTALQYAYQPQLQQGLQQNLQQGEAALEKLEGADRSDSIDRTNSTDSANGTSGADGYDANRPNWLTVIVGQLTQELSVVLISDKSESVRFAQTRKTFVESLSRQLLKPARELDALGDTLANATVSHASSAEAVAAFVERMHAQARAVQAASKRMNHMIADLLLLLKAQQTLKSMARERAGVLSAMQAAQQQYTAEASARGVRVVVQADEHLAVRADSEQLVVALGKLLDNAIRYSAPRGVVSMSAKLAPAGKYVEMRVIDQGAGIPAAEQSRVFERFYRGAHQAPHTRDGVGLGLAIVKHVALTHHGRVAVWSKVHQGSTFMLAMPVAEATRLNGGNPSDQNAPKSAV